MLCSTKRDSATVIQARVHKQTLTSTNTVRSAAVIRTLGDKIRSQISQNEKRFTGITHQPNASVCVFALSVHSGFSKARTFQPNIL